MLFIFSIFITIFLYRKIPFRVLAIPFTESVEELYIEIHKNYPGGPERKIMLGALFTRNNWKSIFINDIDEFKSKLKKHQIDGLNSLTKYFFYEMILKESKNTHISRDCLKSAFDYIDKEINKFKSRILYQEIQKTERIKVEDDVILWDLMSNLSARIDFEKEKMTKAKGKCYNKLKMDSLDEHSWFLLGQIIENENRLTQAIAHYSRTLVIEPDHEEAQIRLKELKEKTTSLQRKLK